MRTVNFSEARSNLKEVLDTVASDHKITIVTRRDSEDAVIMSLSDYNSLQETLYLFGSQANAERLHAAMQEADASLPTGARVLGPKGFGASRTGSPTVVKVKKAAENLTRRVRNLAIKGKRLQGGVTLKNGDVAYASGKLNRAVVAKGKAKKVTAKAPSAAKVAAKRKRKG